MKKKKNSLTELTRETVQERRRRVSSGVRLRSCVFADRRTRQKHKPRLREEE